MPGLGGHLAGRSQLQALLLERDEQEALVALPCCSKVVTVCDGVKFYLLWKALKGGEGNMLVMRMLRLSKERSRAGMA